MLLDIVGIGLLDTKKVFIRYLLFIRAVPLFNIHLQFIHRCMQVDQQVGLYHLLVNDLEDSLVKTKFIFGQVDLGKQKTFGKKIIGQGEILEHIFLLKQFLQLFEPFRHKKQFQWKCILAGILIKFGKKRIVCKLFQDQPGVIMLRKQVCKSSLTGPDISFYCDKLVIHCYLVDMRRFEFEEEHEEHKESPGARRIYKGLCVLRGSLCALCSTK